MRREQLNVLKIAYHLTKQKDVVQEIAGSFQFLSHPSTPPKKASKVSRISRGAGPKAVVTEQK